MGNKGIFFFFKRRNFYDFYTFGYEIWSVGAIGSYFFFNFGFGFLIIYLFFNL